LRKGSDKLNVDMEMMFEELGYKPIDEWTLEELAKGRPRNSDGTWRRGSRPKWITPRISAEIQRRLVIEGRSALGEHLGVAIKLMRDLMLDDTTDVFGRRVVSAQVRADAAKFIIDQVLGKSKQRVDIHTDESFRDILSKAMVVGGKPAHPVIDGELVDDEVNDDEEEDVGDS
jgi:hypothetical protein